MRFFILLVFALAATANAQTYPDRPMRVIITFAPGGPVLTTSFATRGNHVVRLAVSAANGLAGVTSETIPVGPPAFTLMQPFPIVRVLATRGRSGVRLTLLSILTTPGTHITITCKGRGCPIRKQSKIASARKRGLASVSFARFERTLHAGTVLEIRVWKPGQVGKYTRLSLRRGRLRRSDSCLSPGGITPMTCPTSR